MSDARYAVAGEIDLSNAPALEAELMALLPDDDPGSLVVDCAALTFIDAVGIKVLLQVCAAVERRGGAFRLVDVPPLQHRLFAILDIEQTLHLEPQDGIHPPP